MFNSGKLAKVSLSFVLIFGLAISVFFTVGYGQQDKQDMFSDVPKDHWAYQDIQYLAERGIITGLPGGTYKGEQAITRYQVATLVARTVRYLQNNLGSTNQKDLSTLEDLVYKLSERVDSASQTTSQLQSKVNNLESQVKELRASAGPENYDQLVKRSQNNFILGVTGVVLGAGALAWTLLFN
ncbi:MAG: S-layer homology domain-containing protein [Candidatus Bipolaricaulia bacterium]